MNSVMSKWLNEYQVLQRLDTLKLEPRLIAILSTGILEVEGCYLLRAELPEAFDLKEAIKTLFDRTGIECFFNHIHIGDYIDRPEINMKFLLEQGLLYTNALHDILPNPEEFNVILAYSSDPIIDCNVRFHKKRNKEEWLAKNIDGYDEGILVLG